MTIPLELEGSGVTGLLQIVGVPETTTDADRDVLAILATQAAIALQNAYLHERALALAARDSLTNLLNRRAIKLDWRRRWRGPSGASIHFVC